MKHKSTGMFMTGKGSTAAGGGVMEAAAAAAAALEIRPGGMLVQKRNSDSDHSSIPVAAIKVKVKYGSSYLEFSISSQASFGDLKKMVAGPTGVHHEDQKLIFKDKERESKSFLDVAGVKDGSKMVLIEDVISRERRCLELRKNAKMDKASKEIAEISLEVDKFAKQVANLESQIYGGKGVVEKVLLNLIEQLMTQLIKLDGIVADGDVKLRRRFQVKRVQKYIETLDMLKVKNSMIRAEEAKIEPMQHHKKISTGQMPINPIQQQQQQQEQQRKHQPIVVTTKWETFDTGMSSPFYTAATAIKPNNNAASYKQSWEYFV